MCIDFFVEEIRAVGCFDPVRDIPFKLLKELMVVPLPNNWLSRDLLDDYKVESQ